MADECRVEMIDGEPIRVRGAKAMTDEDRAAFAEVVRAAKSRFFPDHEPPNSETGEH